MFDILKYLNILINFIKSFFMKKAESSEDSTQSAQLTTIPKESVGHENQTKDIKNKSVMVRLTAPYEDIDDWFVSPTHSPETSTNKHSRAQQQGSIGEESTVQNTNETENYLNFVNENFVKDLRDIFLHDKSTFNIFLKKKESEAHDPNIKIYNSRAGLSIEESIMEELEEKGYKAESTQNVSDEPYVPITTKPHWARFKNNNEPYTPEESSVPRTTKPHSALLKTYTDYYVRNFKPDFEHSSEEVISTVDNDNQFMPSDDLTENINLQTNVPKFRRKIFKPSRNVEEILESFESPVEVPLPPETFYEKLDRYQDYLLHTYRWNVRVPLYRINKIIQRININNYDLSYTSIKNQCIRYKNNIKYYYNYVFDIENQRVWDEKLNRFISQVLFNSDTYRSIFTRENILRAVDYFLSIPEGLQFVFKFTARGLGFLSRPEYKDFIDRLNENKDLLERQRTYFSWLPGKILRPPFVDLNTKYGKWIHEQQFITYRQIITTNYENTELRQEEIDIEYHELIGDSINFRAESREIEEDSIQGPFKPITTIIPQKLKEIFEPKLEKSRDYYLNKAKELLNYIPSDLQYNLLAKYLTMQYADFPVNIYKLNKKEITVKEFLILFGHPERRNKQLLLYNIKLDDKLTPDNLLTILSLIPPYYNVISDSLIYFLRKYVHTPEKIIEQEGVVSFKECNEGAILQEHPLIWAPMPGIFTKNKLITIGELITLVEQSLSEITKLRLQAFINKYNLDDQAKNIILYNYIRMRNSIWKDYASKYNELSDFMYDDLQSEIIRHNFIKFVLENVLKPLPVFYQDTFNEFSLSLFRPYIDRYVSFNSILTPLEPYVKQLFEFHIKRREEANKRANYFAAGQTLPEYLVPSVSTYLSVYGKPTETTYNVANYIFFGDSILSQLNRINPIFKPYDFLINLYDVKKGVQEFDTLRKNFFKNYLGYNPYCNLDVLTLLKFFSQNPWIFVQIAINNFHIWDRYTLQKIQKEFKDACEVLVLFDKEYDMHQERGYFRSPQNEGNVRTQGLELFLKSLEVARLSFLATPNLINPIGVNKFFDYVIDTFDSFVYRAVHWKISQLVKKEREADAFIDLLFDDLLDDEEFLLLIREAGFGINLDLALPDDIYRKLFDELDLLYLPIKDKYGDIQFAGPTSYLDKFFLLKELNPNLSKLHRHSLFFNKSLVASELFDRPVLQSPKINFNPKMSMDQLRLFLYLKTEPRFNQTLTTRTFKQFFLKKVTPNNITTDAQSRAYFAILKNNFPALDFKDLTDFLNIISSEPRLAQQINDVVKKYIEQSIPMYPSKKVKARLNNIIAFDALSYEHHPRSIYLTKRFTQRFFEEQETIYDKYIRLIPILQNENTIFSRLYRITERLVADLKNYNIDVARCNLRRYRLNKSFENEILEKQFQFFVKQLENIQNKVKNLRSEPVITNLVVNRFDQISHTIFNQLKYNEKFKSLFFNKHFEVTEFAKHGPFNHLYDSDICNNDLTPKHEEVELNSETKKILIKSYDNFFIPPQTQPNIYVDLLKDKINYLSAKLDNLFYMQEIHAISRLIYIYGIRPIFLNLVYDTERFLEWTNIYFLVLRTFYIRPIVNQITYALETNINDIKNDIKTFFNEIKRGFYSTQPQRDPNLLYPDRSRRNPVTRPIIRQTVIQPTTIQTSDVITESPLQLELEHGVENVDTIDITNKRSPLIFKKDSFLPTVTGKFSQKPIKIIPYKSIESYKILSFNGYRRIEGFEFRSRRLHDFTYFNFKALDIKKLIPKMPDTENIEPFRSLIETPNLLVKTRVIDFVISFRNAFTRLTDFGCKNVAYKYSLWRHTKNIILYYNKIKMPAYSKINFDKNKSVNSLDAQIYNILKYQNLEPQCKPVLIKCLNQKNHFNIFGKLIKKTVTFSLDDFYTSYYNRVEDVYPFLDSPLKHLAANIKISINHGLDYTFRLVGLKDNLTQITVFTNNSYISFFHFIKTNYNHANSLWYYPEQVLITIKDLLIKKKPRFKLRFQQSKGFRGRFLIQPMSQKPFEKEIGIVKQQIIVQNENRDHIFLLQENINRYPHYHDIYIIAGDDKPVQKFTQLSSYKEFMNPALRSLLQFDFGYIKLNYNDLLKGNFLSQKFILNINYKINIDKSFSRSPKVELALNNQNQHLNQPKHFLFSEFFKQSNFYLTPYGEFIKHTICRHISQSYKLKELMSNANVLKQTYLSKDNYKVYDKMTQSIHTNWNILKDTDKLMKLSASWIKMYREREFAKNLNPNIYHQLWSYNIVGTIYAAPFNNVNPLNPIRFKSQYRYIISSKTQWPSLNGGFFYPKFAFEPLENRILKIFEFFDTARTYSRKQLDYFLFHHDFNLSCISYDHSLDSWLGFLSKPKIPLSILQKNVYNNNLKNNAVREIDMLYSNIQQCIADILKSPTKALGCSFHTFSEYFRVPVFKFFKKFKDNVHELTESCAPYVSDARNFYGYDICKAFIVLTDAFDIRVTDKDPREWMLLINSLMPLYLLFYKKPGVPIMHQNIRAAYNLYIHELDNRVNFKFDTIIMPNNTAKSYVHRRYTNIFAHYLWSQANELELKPVVMASTNEQFEFSKGNVLNLYKSTIFKHSSLLSSNQQGNYYLSFFKVAQMKNTFDDFVNYFLYSIKNMTKSITNLNIPQSKIVDIAKMVLFDSNYWNGGVIAWHIQNNKLYTQLFTPNFISNCLIKVSKITVTSITPDPDDVKHAGSIVKFDVDIPDDMFFCPFLGKMRSRGQLLLPKYPQFDKFETFSSFKLKKRIHKLKLIRKYGYTHSIKKDQDIIVQALHKLKNYRFEYPEHYSKSKKLVREAYMADPYVPSLPNKTKFDSVNYEGVDWKIFDDFSSILPPVFRNNKHITSLIGDYIKKLNETQPLKLPFIEQKDNKLIETKTKDLILVKKNILSEFYESISDLLKNDTYSWVTFHEYREELMRNQTTSIPGGIISSLISTFCLGSILTFILLAADYRRAPNKKSASRLVSWKVFVLFLLCSFITYIIVDVTGLDVLAELLKPSKFSLGIQKVPQNVILPHQINNTLDDYDSTTFKTPYYATRLSSWHHKKLEAIIDYIFPKHGRDIVEVEKNVRISRKTSTPDFSKLFDFK